MRTLLVTLIVCVFVLPAQAKYSGGTGEPNDPYQIATAADLIALGETPADYDKHFILTADIDLDPNLPGRKVFDKAVIAPHGGATSLYFHGASFTGAFDGNGHRISHLTIAGGSYLGLFGCLASGGAVKNVGLVAVNVAGTEYVGGLMGTNVGVLSWSYCTGKTSGEWYTGGLIGNNDGSMTRCYSTCDVNSRGWSTGGLAGHNTGTVTECHSMGVVTGGATVGGLVGLNRSFGSNGGSVTQCYSAGVVGGRWNVGGLVGANGYDHPLIGGQAGTVSDCYSLGSVSGEGGNGGLVGHNYLGKVTWCYSAGAVSGTVSSPVGGLIASIGAGADVNDCFWDIETSGQMTSAGGTGKTTVEMQTAATFFEGGWDFVGEAANGTEDVWWIFEGRDYPKLLWERVLGDDFEDGKAGPLWFVYEIDPNFVQIREVNGRLETTSLGQAQDVDAIYVADGWRLDTTKDFALRVDFHFSKQGGGDGRVNLGLTPSLDPEARQWAELEAGCFESGPFYLYEVSDGFWVREEVGDRSGDDGTLYMSYNPDTDELYFSHTGYGKPNAWRTVTGLLKGRWAGQPVYVILSGGSEGLAFDGADAWLDNFVVQVGVVLR